jgi:hypothetical protein
VDSSKLNLSVTRKVVYKLLLSIDNIGVHTNALVDFVKCCTLDTIENEVYIRESWCEGLCNVDFQCIDFSQINQVTNWSI